MNSEKVENGTIYLLIFYDQRVKGLALQLLISVLFYLERGFYQTLCTYLQITPLEPLTKPATDKTVDTADKVTIRYFIRQYMS